MTTTTTVTTTQTVITSSRAVDDSPFYRALAAKQAANNHRDWHAVGLADRLAAGGRVDDTDLHRYRQLTAAAAYADAVYEVEAGPIRVRATGIRDRTAPACAV